MNYTRDQIAKADLLTRKLFTTNPEKFCEMENEPTLKQSKINVNFMMDLIK